MPTGPPLTFGLSHCNEPSYVQPAVLNEDSIAIWKTLFEAIADSFVTPPEIFVYPKNPARDASVFNIKHLTMKMFREEFKRRMENVGNLNDLVAKIPWLLVTPYAGDLDVTFNPDEAGDDTPVFIQMPGKPSPNRRQWKLTHLGTARQLKALYPLDGRWIMQTVNQMVEQRKAAAKQPSHASASPQLDAVPVQQLGASAVNVRTECGPLRPRRLEEGDEAAAFRRREGTFNWRMEYDADGQAVECFDSFIHVPENPAGGSAVEAAKEITSHSEVEDRCGGGLGGMLGCCAAAVASSFAVGMLIRWLWQRSKGKTTKKPKPNGPRQTPTTPPANIRRGKPGPATEELDKGFSTPAPSFANATTSKP
eukprot:GHVT01085295.1.p1 GENE.GHVT01085295.1~~GHVT01085295.1.p1  ORF type:complete len:365 (+),score=49.54 GHVT01085295.1:575-1669(+)